MLSVSIMLYFVFFRLSKYRALYFGISPTPEVISLVVRFRVPASSSNSSNSALLFKSIKLPLFSL